jgi:hypothetical protein
MPRGTFFGIAPHFFLTRAGRTVDGVERVHEVVRAWAMQ